MNKKTANNGNVASLNVRWEQDDVDKDLPNRFKKACKKHGFAMSDSVRAMIRGFTEELEKGGCPAIKAGIASARAKKKR